MQELSKLKSIMKESKQTATIGIDHETLKDFIETDPLLCSCIESAYENYPFIKKKFPELLELGEEDKLKKLQERFINFYSPETINPYIPLAAKGPWIITGSGAVVHDSGGYGMLGFGHGPSKIVEEMAKESHVMANIMTANYKQYELGELLSKEIGHSRPEQGKNALKNFTCLNSGSEAVSLALRISEARVTEEKKKGNTAKKYKFLTLNQSFHGRTDLPAQVSSSSLPVYKKYLSTFAAIDNLLTVEINNISALRETFAEAEKEDCHIQAVIFEPVMGEGNPGEGLSPEFYDCARQLSYKHGSTLIIDSIQAGIRAHGCLSIIDYPGFEKLDPPDCETYSKAINAGQYPLSVLAMTDEYASHYKSGLYGNTMTANPRALSVACEVLKFLSPELRHNIVNQGKRFLEEGQKIQAEYGSLVKEIHGTGLLFCLEIDKDRAKVIGFDGLENRLRKKGIGVIHGGTNALRFTPWFGITSQEIDLIFKKLREVFDQL